MAPTEKSLTLILVTACFEKRIQFVSCCRRVTLSCFICCSRFWHWYAGRLWQDVFACGRGRRVSSSLWLAHRLPLWPGWFIVPSLLLFSRNLECLNLLLNTGADFNRKDRFGRWVTL